ncbi:MAG: TrmH family RNA methyltransferase [Pseudonocardia sp.]
MDTSARWTTLGSDGGHVLLDGFHVIKHALRFGADVPLIITSARSEVLDLATRLAPDLQAGLAERLHEVDAATLVALTGSGHHTQVAGLGARPDVGPDLLAGERRRAPAVLLDDPRHLGNIGAAVRVTAGLGGSGVLTTGTADPWHPDALRGSAGLHFAVPVQAIAPADLERLAGPVWAVDPDGTDLRSLRIPDDAVLAFGSERRGLSAGVRARADVVAALPMRPGVSSYNLATSVAMTLYAWAAQ